AKLVEQVEDIIEEVAPQLLSRSGGGIHVAKRELPPHVSDDVRKIVEGLKERPIPIDEIIERSGLTPAKVAEILLHLELGGWVLQLPGKRYVAEG
ncbi:MAG TPA: DNA-protecting protein DprA, partial [Candidatus Binatia bacterium]|nr:DNA-protecting protein DprA [Candidatus Binatia bacterium]